MGDGVRCQLDVETVWQTRVCSMTVCRNDNSLNLTLLKLVRVSQVTAGKYDILPNITSPNPY